jgi:hypothetical protein
MTGGRISVFDGVSLRRRRLADVQPIADARPGDRVTGLA